MARYVADWRQRDGRQAEWRDLRFSLGLANDKAFRAALGISKSTHERYERIKAPTWYRFAIVGLAAERKRTS